MRIHTKLYAIRSNVTRWSSTAKLLSRCIQFQEIWSRIDNDEIEKLVTTKSEYRRIDKLNLKFEELDSVPLALQKAIITVADARCLFENVIEEFPELDQRLKSDRKIIINPHFGNAV